MKPAQRTRWPWRQNKLIEKFPNVALYQQETANNHLNMAATSIELGKFNSSEGNSWQPAIQKKLVRQFFQSS